ncbi:hypothetical protein ACF0H5_006721 [Mactra antiquata]
MVQCKEIVEQSRAISGYRIFGVLQFVLGFFLMFFACYVAMVIHGPEVTGIPYYVGPLTLSIPLICMSFIAALIYDRGQDLSKDQSLVSYIYVLMRVHFVITALAIVICSGSIILTGIYGLSEKCSYSTKTVFNQGMAIFLVILQTLCGISLVWGAYFFYKYFGYFVHKVADDDLKFSHSNLNINLNSIR